jgi:hypothetical protein
MAAVEWPIGPRQRLPQTVAPFRFETVVSYVSRLAHANHLEPKYLRYYVATQARCYPRLDWLAVASGYPEPVLRSRLAGITATDRNGRQQRLHARPACRWCMARRNVYEPVFCWLPDYVTVCIRHQRWIGRPAHTWQDQKHLADQPDVIAAARIHARLCRASDIAESDVGDAQRIVDWWARHRGLLDERHQHHHQIIDAHIAVYPQIIELADILTTYRHRIRASVDVESALTSTVTALHTCIGQRLHLHDLHAEMGPVNDWVHAQKLVARSRPTSTIST